MYDRQTLHACIYILYILYTYTQILYTYIYIHAWGARARENAHRLACLYVCLGQNRFISIGLSLDLYRSMSIYISLYWHVLDLYGSISCILPNPILSTGLYLIDLINLIRLTHLTYLIYLACIIQPNPIQSNLI